MRGNIEQMLQCKKWAVVGASANPDKYGYRIFKVMKAAGLEVYPVNPGIETIDGERCYAALADLPIKPDAVDLVVAAKIGETIVRQCSELKIENVWLQPGADSAALLKVAEELNLAVVHDACIMMELRKKEAK